jgi:hypothetical protein
MTTSGPFTGEGRASAETTPRPFTDEGRASNRDSPRTLHRQEPDLDRDDRSRTRVVPQLTCEAATAQVLQ